MAAFRLKVSYVAVLLALLAVGWITSEAAPTGSGASGNAASERDPRAVAAERLFDGFVSRVDKKANPMFLESGHPDSELTRIDVIAEQLDEETDHSEQQLKAVAEVVNAKGMLAEKASSQAAAQPLPHVGVPRPLLMRNPGPKFKFAPPARTMGLLDAVLPSQQEAKTSPRILHTRRQVDFDKVMQQTVTGIRLLPPRQSKRWSDAVGRLLAREDAEKGIASTVKRPGGADPLWSLRSVVRLTMILAKYSITVLDLIHTSPEFMNEIPVLGEPIAGMKQKSEPLYHLVNVVRSLSEMNGYAMGPRNNATHAKRVLGKTGTRALKSVGRKVLKHSGFKLISPEELDEFVERACGAILAAISARSSTS